jgi:hypothetical protein
MSILLYHRLACPRVLAAYRRALRCDAAIFPESEVDRTCRCHRESDANGPKRKRRVHRSVLVESRSRRKRHHSAAFSVHAAANLGR